MTWVNPSQGVNHSEIWTELPLGILCHCVVLLLPFKVISFTVSLLKYILYLSSLIWAKSSERFLHLHNLHEKCHYIRVSLCTNIIVYFLKYILCNQSSFSGFLFLFVVNAIVFFVFLILSIFLKQQMEKHSCTTKVNILYKKYIILHPNVYYHPKMQNNTHSVD